MPRFIPKPGSTEFITFSCYRRLPLLGTGRLRDAFCAHLDAVHRTQLFQLHAFVVMPEHVHLLLTIEDSLPSVLQRIKQPFAQRVVGRWRELGAPALDHITTARETSHYWMRGGGYRRTIRTHSDLQEKIRYIHENPVKRGLVLRPEEWVWSSAAYWMCGREGMQLAACPL